MLLDTAPILRDDWVVDGRSYPPFGAMTTMFINILHY
jgi:hypothetical protein